MRILRHACRHVRLKEGLPFFASGGVLLVWLAAAVLATTVTTVSNNEPGVADEGQIERAVTVDEAGTVADVNITVDFHKIPKEECAGLNGAPGEAAFSDSAASSMRGHARQTRLNPGLLVSLSGPFFGLLT